MSQSGLATFVALILTAMVIVTLWRKELLFLRSRLIAHLSPGVLDFLDAAYL